MGIRSAQVHIVCSDIAGAPQPAPGPLQLRFRPVLSSRTFLSVGRVPFQTQLPVAFVRPVSLPWNQGNPHTLSRAGLAFGRPSDTGRPGKLPPPQLSPFYLHPPDGLALVGYPGCGGWEGNLGESSRSADLR